MMLASSNGAFLANFFSKSKTFNFNLSGIDNAKETIESLVTMCDEKGFKHSETETSFSIILVKSDDLKEKVAGIFAVCQSSEIFYLSLEERVELNRIVYKKAKELGIPILTEEQFLQMIQ